MSNIKRSTDPYFTWILCLKNSTFNIIHLFKMVNSNLYFLFFVPTLVTIIIPYLVVHKHLLECDMFVKPLRMLFLI